MVTTVKLPSDQYKMLYFVGTLREQLSVFLLYRVDRISLFISTFIIYIYSVVSFISAIVFGIVKTDSFFKAYLHCVLLCENKQNEMFCLLSEINAVKFGRIHIIGTLQLVFFL